MRRLSLLLKVRLSEFFSLSSFLKEKNNAKKTYQVLHFGILFIIAILMLIFSNSFSHLLAENGYASLLPVLGYVIGSILSFIVTVLKINETLYGRTDSEFLLSTPISTYGHAISLFLMIYANNMIYILLLTTPMGLVYGSYYSMNAAFYIRWVIGLIFTSLITSGLAALMGVVLALILTTTRKANLIWSILALTVIGVFAFFIVKILDGLMPLFAIVTNYTPASYMNNISEITTDADSLITGIITNYRFARFYQFGIVEGQIGWFFLYILSSFLFYFFFFSIVSVGYQEIISALRSPLDFRENKLTKIKVSKTAKAIYKKEAAQIINSKSYLLHMLTPFVIAIVLGIYVLVRATYIPYNIYSFLHYTSPVILCLIVGFSSISYCSYSMEGKRHWLNASLPLDEKEIYKAKLKVNLIFTIPPTILLGIIYSLALDASVILTIANIVIPVIYCIVISTLGLRLDKKYCSFLSENEHQIMHQGRAYVLCGLPQMIIPLIIIILLIL